MAAVRRDIEPARPRSSAWFPVAVVLLLGFALRLLHLGSALRSPLSYQPGPDEEFYALFGRAVASGDAMDPMFAFMDPGYGYLLGAIYRLLGDGLFPIYMLQVLVDTGTALLVFLIGRELKAPRAGLAGAGLYALASSAILLATTLQKETWVAHFTAWFVLLAVRLVRDDRWFAWLLFGLLCGLGIALRGNLALAPAMAVVLLPLLLRPRRPWRHVLGSLAVLGAGLALPLLLLAARNAQLSGVASPLPNNGGVVLHQLYNETNPRSLSTAPPFVGYYHPMEIWRGYSGEARRRLGRTPTPHEVDRYWRGQAVAYVLANPGQVVRNATRKLGEFMSFREVPNNRSMADERLFSAVLRWLPLPFGWLLALGLPGLLLLWRGDRRTVLAVVPIAVAAVTVAVFFAEDRFRFPAVPMLALGAGALLERMSTWLRQGRWRPLAIALGAAAAIAAVSWLGSRHLVPPSVSWERITWGYIRMGQLDEAGALAADRLRARPDNASLQEALGYIAIAQGREMEAIERYRAALAVRPGAHVARYNLARLLARAGRRDEALREARAAARLSPQPDYLALVAALERGAEDPDGR